MSSLPDGIINTGDVAPEPFIPPAPMVLERNGVMLPIDLIDCSDRIRDVSEAGAALMADSMAAKGLISPILVRPIAGDRYRLVIGGHRIAGAQLLQWREIRCDVREMDDDEAEDLELRENLDRTDLTKLDQMIFMARRKALDHRLQSRPKHGGDRKSTEADQRANIGALIPRFTEELAEQVGRSERAIQRAIQIVENLDPEAIRLIRGTKHADIEQSLLKLSREAPAKQRTLALQLNSGEAKTIAQAAVKAGFEEAPPEGGDPQGVALAQLLTAWMKADAATRLTFLGDIDAAYLTEPREPIMTKEMEAALASPAPSRGGRKPGKGAR